MSFLDWLLLVRHGEAEHHTRGLTGGWTDLPLTETGRDQLRQLGQRIKRDFGALPFQIITSDLVRAKESAQIISEVTGFPIVEAVKWLREKNNGIAAGLHEEEARKLAYSPLPDKPLDWRRYEGGETRREFFNRVAKPFERVVKNYSHVIVVAHKGTLQQLLFRSMGFKTRDQVANHNISFEISPASLTVVQKNRWGENSLVLLNDRSHLLPLR